MHALTSYEQGPVAVTMLVSWCDSAGFLYAYIWEWHCWGWGWGCLPALLDDAGLYLLPVIWTGLQRQRCSPRVSQHRAQPRTLPQALGTCRGALPIIWSLTIPFFSLQAPPQLSGSGGVGVGPVVVPDGGGEGAHPPPGSSRSRPDPPQKAK